MSRRPLIYDVVYVKYEDPDGKFVIDEPAVVEEVWSDEFYEVLFLIDTVYGVPRQAVEYLSLNAMTPEQVEAARQIKDKLLERFAREVDTGHLVRHTDGALLVLGEETDYHVFQAIDLKTKTERTIQTEDCRRVLPFDLSFAEQLEFEILSQELDSRAGWRMLLTDLYHKNFEAIDQQYDHDDLEWGRAKGEMLHRWYGHFPEESERDFRAQQEFDRKYALVDGHVSFLEDWLDEEQGSSK